MLAISAATYFFFQTQNKRLWNFRKVVSTPAVGHCAVYVLCLSDILKRQQNFV